MNTSSTHCDNLHTKEFAYDPWSQIICKGRKAMSWAQLFKPRMRFFNHTRPAAVQSQCLQDTVSMRELSDLFFGVEQVRLKAVQQYPGQCSHIGKIISTKNRTVMMRFPKSFIVIIYGASTFRAYMDGTCHLLSDRIAATRNGIHLLSLNQFR